MLLENQIIEFKGMPLFQKARFKSSSQMQGTLQNMACFFYMVEGNLLSMDSRGLHRIGKKEAIIKSCNNYVQRYESDPNSETCMAVVVYLYPHLLKTIYKDEIPSFLKKEETPMPKKVIGNQLIEQYINNLAIYFNEPEALDEELGILKLKELMMILLKSQNQENIRNLLSEIFAPINVKFKEAIERNLFNNLNLEQLAFICNMSLSTFKREFKKNFNETPAKYIKKRRLEHAASLLLATQEPISAIAFDSGFQDVSTFSSSFQEKYNTSPKNYRLNQIRN